MSNKELDSKSSRDYLNTAELINDVLNDLRSKAAIYLQFGLANQVEGEMDIALNFYTRAYAVAHKSNNFVNKISACKAISSIDKTGIDGTINYDSLRLHYFAIINEL